MLLNRSTRTLPFIASLTLVASSALGLVVGAKKDMPKGVAQLELIGSLPQALASLGLVAFAAGLAGFVRVVEARVVTAQDRDPDARTHSNLVLAAGVAGGVLHAAAGVALVADDSQAEGFRALSCAESLAIALMVVAAIPAFRATKRLGAAFLGGAAALGLLARGSLVIVPGRFSAKYVVDPLDLLWVITSLAFGLWTIVASVSSTAPERAEDAAPASRSAA